MGLHLPPWLLGSAVIPDQAGKSIKMLHAWLYQVRPAGDGEGRCRGLPGAHPGGNDNMGRLRYSLCSTLSVTAAALLVSVGE